MTKEEKLVYFEKYNRAVAHKANEMWNSWKHRNSAHTTYLSREDIVQECMIKLWETIEKIDLMRNEKQKYTFVVLSITNFLLNMFRDLTRQKKTYQSEHNNTDDLPAIDSIEEDISKQVVYSLYEQLNSNERRFIKLKLEGRSKAEIIKSLHWTEETWITKTNLIKDVLKEIINEQKYKENKEINETE